MNHYNDLYINAFIWGCFFSSMATGFVCLVVFENLEIVMRWLRRESV